MSGPAEPIAGAPPHAALFADASDGYFFTDQRGVIRALNARGAALLDHPREALLGKPLLACVGAADRWSLLALLGELAAASEARTWVGSLEWPGGRQCPVHATALPYHAAGERSGIEWLVREQAGPVEGASPGAVREARLHELQAKFADRALAATDQSSLLDEAVRAIADTRGAARVGLWLLDDAGALRLAAGVGWSTDRVGEPSSSPAGLLAGQALVRGRALAAEVAYEPLRPDARAAEADPCGELCVLVPSANGPVGVLTILADGPHQFNASDARALEMLASLLGLGLARLRGEANWRAHLAHADATEVRYQELERLRLTFLSAVRHELLTPVAIIKAHAEHLRDPTTRGTPGLANAASAAIEGEADRLYRLVANLLDAASVSTGHFQVEQAPILLGPIVEQVVASFQGRSRRHRFHVALPADIPLLLGDRTRLEGVLYNLLDNALKYAPHGGDVVVSATVHAADVEVAVADRGMGIALGEQARVFEPHYRADHGPRAGSGLGLYVCKAIVEALGGRIWLESAPGQGTTVRFTVPRDAPDDTREEA